MIVNFRTTGQKAYVVLGGILVNPYREERKDAGVEVEEVQALYSTLHPNGHVYVAPTSRPEVTPN
jgi:hypothetical protein